ncbi:MAG: hypothetical protein U0271_32060 [Polyangiaceae bacterium]
MKVTATLLAVLFAFALVPLGCSSSSEEKKPPRIGEGSDPPNAPCSGSHVCQTWGWCEERDGECVATQDSHCASSEACKKGGLCSLEGTRCVAKKGDCERSEWCKEFKLCTLAEGVCK